MLKYIHFYDLKPAIWGRKYLGMQVREERTAWFPSFSAACYLNWMISANNTAHCPPLLTVQSGEVWLNLSANGGGARPSAAGEVVATAGRSVSDAGGRGERSVAERCTPLRLTGIYLLHQPGVSWTVNLPLTSHNYWDENWGLRRDGTVTTDKIWRQL